MAGAPIKRIRYHLITSSTWIAYHHSKLSRSSHWHTKMKQVPNVTRLKKWKPQTAFRFAFFFVSRTKSFGLVRTFSITFQSSLQRSMYAGESLIWEKSVPGLDRYFSEFVTGRQNVNNQTHLKWPEMSRPNKCKVFTRMQLNFWWYSAQIMSLNPENIRWIRVTDLSKLVSSLTLDNLMTSRNLV